MFYLVSVAEQVGLSLTFSEAPKTSFLASRPNKPLPCSIFYVLHSSPIFIQFKMYIRMKCTKLVKFCKIPANVTITDILTIIRNL